MPSPLDGKSNLLPYFRGGDCFCAPKARYTPHEVGASRAGGFALPHRSSTVVATRMKPETPFEAPQITSVDPIAALPGGEIGVHGAHLGPFASRLPVAMLGDLAATVLLSRRERMLLRVPDEAESG